MVEMMPVLLLGNWLDARLWWALPLLVATSLVYSATRHEWTREILSGAVRTFLFGTAFMGAIYLLLWVVR